MKQYHANKKNHESRCVICNDHCKQEEKLNAGLEVGVGSLVSVRFNDVDWRSGTITKFNAETKDYTVIFLDGDVHETKITDNDVKIVRGARREGDPPPRQSASSKRASERAHGEDEYGSGARPRLAVASPNSPAQDGGPSEGGLAGRVAAARDGGGGGTGLASKRGRGRPSKSEGGGGLGTGPPPSLPPTPREREKVCLCVCVCFW
jgi:hypothetical protein